MESKPNPETDQYLYFDPKSSKKTDGKVLPKTKTTFQSAIVFVVGGGNYPEALNLQEYSQVIWIKSFPLFLSIALTFSFLFFFFYVRNN